jgi:hypothetical protein
MTRSGDAGDVHYDDPRADGSPTVYLLAMCPWPPMANNIRPSLQPPEDNAYGRAFTES